MPARQLRSQQRTKHHNNVFDNKQLCKEEVQRNKHRATCSSDSSTQSVPSHCPAPLTLPSFRGLVSPKLVLSCSTPLGTLSELSGSLISLSMKLM